MNNGNRQSGPRPAPRPAPRGSRADVERLRILFRDIVFRSRSIASRRMARLALTPTQFVALRAVFVHDGATVGDLAEELSVSPPVMTRILDRLERSGHVRRQADTADRRRMTIRLTPRGRRFQKRISEVWAGIGESMFQGFTPVERETLVSALDRVHANLDRIGRAGR